MPDDDGRPADSEAGSYTARPSKEPPREGVTRDEDEEAVERTDGEHEVADGDEKAGSHGADRGTGDGSGAG